MSSYLDFSVERLVKAEDGTTSWKCIGKSNYSEDIDIINPYILKGAFWDTDCFQHFAGFDDRLSKESLLMFGTKIEKIDIPASENDFWYKAKKKLYDTPEYPYKYKLVELKRPVTSSSNLEDELHDLKNDIRYKWNDIWVPFTEEVVNENLEKFISIMNLESDNVQEVINKTEELKKCKTFAECSKEKFSNVRFVAETGSVYIKFTTVSEALNTIQHYLNLKNLALFDYIIICNYVDEDSKLVPQYSFENVRISNYDDIQAMIHEFEKSLADLEKRASAENLAKSIISEILEDISEEDQSTKLYEALKDYVDVDYSSEDSEWKEELQSQLEELKLLARFVGKNGRLIWEIS